VDNDIENLLRGFGASAEDYLEVDDFHEYRELPRMQSPSPGLTKEQFVQAQGQVHIAAAPKEVVALPAAVVQPEAVGNADNSEGWGSHVVAAARHASLLEELVWERKAVEGIGQLLRSRLKVSVTYGQAS